MVKPGILSRLREIAETAMNPDAAPPHLNTYEKRRQAARAIGQELYR